MKLRTILLLMVFGIATATNHTTPPNSTNATTPTPELDTIAEAGTTTPDATTVEATTTSTTAEAGTTTPEATTSTTPTPELHNDTTATTPNNTTQISTTNTTAINYTNTTHISVNEVVSTAIQRLSTVTFAATMSMSFAEFNSTKRDAYVVGVAQALSVPLASVAIGNVTETDSRRRRLLTPTIEVQTVVTVQGEYAASVAASATIANINAALESIGITVDGVTQATVYMVRRLTTIESILSRMGSNCSCNL